jgi:hypothetical protein
MRAPARHSTAQTGYDALDADEHYAHGELLPGERIGPPLARTGGKAVFRGVVLLIALGGGWALLGDRVSWPRWLLAEFEAVSASTDRRVGPVGPVEPAASRAATTSLPVNAESTTKPAPLDAPPPTLQPPAPSKAATTPDAAVRPAAPPQTTTAVPPAATGVDEPAAQPLPSAIADPADPYQMRAVAVGLHPDLSRVLLARLSPTDYRNAGTAIQTAMAETPDSGVFVWPRQRKPELALFQVRFVPGAAPSCRRYVVTITKDGWLTTAPPMEKCGSEPRRAQRK